jgi:tellurite resistance protein TerC
VRAEQTAGWAATPLFLCLVVIEFADVMFAFDSVPAIIAITEKPFLVYTSNIFAILGLRSMYFFLAAAKRYLIHLEKAVICILVYIGLKMLVTVAFDYHTSALASLAVVLGLLAAGVAASFIFKPKTEQNGS